MKDFGIAFIGAGNMASSLIGGLITDGLDVGRIHIADPDPRQRQRLADQHGVNTHRDNREAVARADVVVLAVKPQVLEQVCRDLAPALTRRHLVISIAAGVRETALRAWLGEHTPIVRTMPNTPALVGSGATALTANPKVSEEQRQLAESIMRAVGTTVWLSDEAQMDAVTAISGSGPAYFFMVMEVLEAAAVKLGLSPEVARLLSVQTAFGAAKLALESSESPAELRARVTSPGGTTERATRILEEAGLGVLFERATRAAHNRSCELAAALGKKQ